MLFKLNEIDEKGNIIQTPTFDSQQETEKHLIVRFKHNTDIVNFAKFEVTIYDKDIICIERFDASYDDYEIYQPVERCSFLDLDIISMDTEIIACYFKKLIK